MRLSSLVTLGLCAASSLARGPDGLEDIVVVEVTALGQKVTDIKNPREHECVAYNAPDEDGSVGKIRIIPLSPPLSSPHVKCSFYYEPNCQGDGTDKVYTLEEGTYTFARDFLVHSYQCYKSHQDSDSA